ncbi:MAG: NAD(+)/NADH kinase [candidate division KSB1 bacterium]|nr:NAD(+)/NADH kinase [candidate division KSB1 bacterium]MDZ7301551.1 NAD(+)/NADH kinase [candidate division KSB1 bacterium]MDZ7311033.1 NAD(+)/NADH kinase [candidate division KSB1 bacterium]
MTTATRTVDARRGQKPPKRLQIYYHPKIESSEAFAEEMAYHVQRLGIQGEAVSLMDEAAKAQLPEYDMIVVIGGDGAMLRGGCMAALHNMPVIGVNYGRLGFLAEVQPHEWKGVIARILVGDYWLEERTMLHVEHYRGDEKLSTAEALNEAVVSRGALARPIRLHTWVDGDDLTTYVADGLIVATATGSTAYALAVGGPILPPELKNILIVPIAPHLCIERAIVLSEGAVLKIFVRTDHQAILSADGQKEVPLHDGDHVIVRRSDFVARFVRVQEPTYFYRNLNSRMSQNPSVDKAK